MGLGVSDLVGPGVVITGGLEEATGGGEEATGGGEEATGGGEEEAGGGTEVGPGTSGSSRSTPASLQSWMVAARASVWEIRNRASIDHRGGGRNLNILAISSPEQLVSMHATDSWTKAVLLQEHLKSVRAQPVLGRPAVRQVN